MAFAPLRFLHAADARLDQAIGETPKLPPRLASIVQDATRAAFDRFIALAIEHEVDFVLLAGNTFVEDDQSLAARMSLLEGFEQLERANIRALILPGVLDPPEAWKRIPDLSENVALLEPGPKGILPIKRDDRVVARVGTELFFPARKKARRLRDELRSATQRPVTFKIAALNAGDVVDDAALLGEWSPGPESGLTPPTTDVPADRRDRAQETTEADRRRHSVDYVALGCGMARRTVTRRSGIVHDPGPLQGRGPDQSGPHGCTLVTVEPDGTVRCDFLPTASVRWEKYSVQVPAPAPLDRGELLAKCREPLDRLRTEACENAWIFHWVFRGSRSAIEPLEDDGFRRQLRQDLTDATTVPNGENSIHQIVLEPDRDSTECPESVDPLEADLLETLLVCGDKSPDVFRQSLDELRSTDANWADTLGGLLSGLDEQAIRANADRIGHELFRAGAPGAAR
jgi:DNA repair exonuclease SbcCD nuclease subunit